MQTERNLLFGILCLQLKFLDNDRLAEACLAWATDKSGSLPDLLVDRGWLTPQARAEIESILNRLLQRHEGDVQASLAKLMSLPIRNVLAVLADSGIDRSLAQLLESIGRGPDPGELPTAVGQTRARYTLTLMHAEGGMGSVWMARDEELGREIALKEIKPDFSREPALRDRFLAEARITGQLEHPGIVPVYELVSSPLGEAPFYTMRFVHGKTFGSAVRAYHERVAQGTATALELRDLLQAFISVCNAIAYAHSRGVVHRDLKGDNILLGPFGEVLVLDWGLARVLPTSSLADGANGGNRDELEAEGAILGTPAYMAPEQACGQVQQIDPQTDVYGLGAILYEVLTGRPPVSGKSLMDVLLNVQEGRIVPPRQRAPWVAPALDAICRKALARDKSLRYGAALELADEVKRWIADEPVTAWPDPWTVRVRRWVSRHRTLVTSAAVALVMAVVALTVSTLLLQAANERERSARIDANEKEHQAMRERDRAEAGEQALRRSFYLSQIRLGQNSWERGDVARVRSILASLIPEEGKEDLRGFEWYYLRQLTYERGAVNLGGHRGAINALAFSPQGDQLVVAADDVTIRDPMTRTIHATLRGHRGDVTTMAYSPDSEVLATGSDDGTVRLWDRTGKQLAVLQDHGRPVTAVAFSPDGRWLATAGLDSRVRLRDPRTGQTLRTLELASPLEERKEGSKSVSFAPDSATLAIGDASSQVYFWNLVTNQKREATLGASVTGTGRVVYSPRGETLAVVGSSVSGGVELIDVATLRTRGRLLGHQQTIRALVFSPDGETVVTGSNDRTVRHWDARTGQELSRWNNFDGTILSLAWSMHSPWLAVGTAQGSVSLWEPRRRQEFTALRERFPDTQALTFLPRSHTLAAGFGTPLDPTSPGTVAFWEDRKRVRYLQGGEKPVAIALSPDAQSLLVGYGDPARPEEGGQVRWFDPTTGREQLRVAKPSGAVTFLAVSPDGQVLATAILGSSAFTGEGTSHVVLRNARTGTLLRTFAVGSGGISGMAFSPDGKTLATGSIRFREDPPGAIALWEVATGRSLGELTGPMEPVVRLTFSPDGRRLAGCEAPFPPSSTRPGIARLWDVASGEELVRCVGHAGFVWEVAFSPDGATLATAGEDGTARLWNSHTGETLHRLDTGKLPVIGVSFVAEGKKLATATGTFLQRFQPGELSLWDVESGRRTTTSSGYLGAPTQLVSLADRNLMATMSEPGLVSVWNAETAEQSRIVVGQKPDPDFGVSMGVRAVAASPDGALLATGASDRRIHLWDTKTGKIRVVLTGHTAPVSTLAFSPDGKWLASGSGHDLAQPRAGEVLLWEVATGQLHRDFSTAPTGVSAVAFTPDGRYLLAGLSEVAPRGTVRVWDTKSLEPAPPLELADQGPVTCLAFDRSGTHLAIGDRLSLVGVYDFPNRKRLRIQVGHTGGVLAAAWSPDGRTLATASLDRTIKLWQTYSGEELLTLRGHVDAVTSLAFSDDGMMLASGGVGKLEKGELFQWLAERGPLHRETVYDPTQARKIQRRVETFDEREVQMATAYYDAANQLLPIRVLVQGVIPDSQGEKLGLAKGDRLHSFAGKPIRSIAALNYVRTPNGAGELIFERQGERHSVQVESGLLGLHLNEEPE